jgi:hypothetical protein
MATNNSLFGLGGAGIQVVVYGPDGKAYGSPAQAIAAGVTNYTMSPPAGVMPTPAPAAPAYTQQYIPGNYTPKLTDDDGNPLPLKYGDPIYSRGGRDNPSIVIGRVGMTPVVSGSSREGNVSVSFNDDPTYQKSQQLSDFQARIASGEIQASSPYGNKTRDGMDFSNISRNEAYTSYDPTTNIVKFYDPEGNVTTQGQRTKGSLGFLGDAITSGLAEFNKNDLGPLTQAIMLGIGGAGLMSGTGGFAGLNAGLDLGGADAIGTAIGGGGAGTEALAGLGGSPFAPAASAAGSSAGYIGAAAPIGSTFTGLGGSPFAPATSAAGQIPGYASATQVGLGSNLAGLSSSPVAPAASVAGATPGYVSAAGTGGGLLSSLLPSIITGGLQGIGAANTAEKAREAAQIQAQAQVEAARIAADAAKFRPVGVTTRFGTSNFTTDAQGNVIGAGYTASPEIKAYQDRLSALAAQGLTGAEGAQAAYAPLTAGAQSLFNLGQGYIQQTPEQQAAAYIAKQQALLAPGQEQQLAQLQNRLLAQGRGGLSVAQGGTMAATSPELAAYYNALAQSNLQLAAQGQQAGQQQAQFGAGLLGAGSDLMGKYYAGQTAAYAPFATAMDTTTGLENLAQQPMTLGTQIGARTTAANADAGRLLSQGMLQSAATQAPANAFSQSGNIFGQFGSNPQLMNALNTSFGVTDPNQVAMQALLKKIYGV